MDTQKEMLIINGEDKSDSVTSFRFFGGKCHVVYNSGPKTYSYNGSNVRVLKLQKSIDPQSVIITAKGRTISGVDKLLDFGEFYKIVRSGRKTLSYPKRDVELAANCLADKGNLSLFSCFKETAESISLVTDEGKNILRGHYEKISGVSEETVLAGYLSMGGKIAKRTAPSVLIYPFGLNQSQKRAVENAFSSQVSIIQGPPGTGKTQTILNIIANAVRNGKTVAVVSNNNPATFNVAEKLEKKGVSFITAFLGNRKNKERFLNTQSGKYPDMSTWQIEKNEKKKLDDEVKRLSEELNNMLNAKNRIAAIEQELLELKPEEFYFSEFYSAYNPVSNGEISIPALPSKKVFALWLEYEYSLESLRKMSLLKRLSIILRFSRTAWRLFSSPPEFVIPSLQKYFYIVRKRELAEEKKTLEKKLKNYSFTQKMQVLEEKSFRLFRAELAQKYKWQCARPIFGPGSLASNSKEFCREYPVILSTTYSIKGTLDVSHIYDYIIVDEASQVNLATGVLAFSCARNIVIVGDQKQLPNVLTDDDKRAVDMIWSRYSFDEMYRFSVHSLLSSAIAVWKDAPSVLLREHYRCHPKIAGFCNRKFYNGELIVMTEDKNEPKVLSMYRTVVGNHARGHLNQREIDTIKTEVLPALEQKGQRDIGIITPYRDQVEAISSQLGDTYEVDTVHKFQGREKDAIILTSVDNVITDFVDDPHMLNVAVSRAINSLAVIISQDPRNDKTNYGDLAKYIEYNNCAIINSTVFSVFDLLYKGYAEQRRQYLKKHKRVSEHDSENLMYSVIEEIIGSPKYSNVDCAIHIPLALLVKDHELLDSDERAYTGNPLTHVDFVLFNKMDKFPIMAIEVDGTRYHAKGCKQAERDSMKNNILEKCKIPLLRMRTDGSGERERIEEQLSMYI